MTAKVLGELPNRSVVRAVQDLHFNPMLGRTGRFINGIGGARALGMWITGLLSSGGQARAAGAWSLVFLCGTGLAMWWTRVVRPRLHR